MAHLEITQTPARETDDPFGLHDPLTLDDLIRIEKTLDDGAVEEEEAERLRAIHDVETAKFRQEISPAIEAIAAPLKDIGVKTAASLAKSFALPDHFAGLGKLDERLAGFGRMDEALKQALSGLLPTSLDLLGDAQAAESFLPFSPLPPLEKAVLNQGCTLDDIRARIGELVAVVETEHLLMTEQLRKSQEGALEERHRHRVNIRLALIGLVASNAISVIIALLR